MKTTFLAVIAAAFALTACNESFREDAADVRASQNAIYKDNAALSDYENQLARNRAQKAAAKASGDKLRQASESVQIGVNKAAINMKQTERKIDERILEEDKEDLRQ